MSQYIIVENFGKELKLMRKHACLTQRELADKAGVAELTVSRIENEEVEAEMGTIKKILNAFGFNNYEIQYAIKDKNKTLTNVIPKAKKRF